MPGLAGQDGERRDARSRGADDVHQRLEVVVAADHRPARGGRTPAAGSGPAAGRRRGRRRRRPAAGGDPVQARVLAQHGGLQVAQLGDGLEPELVVEHLADLAEHLQRVGLPPGPRPARAPAAPTAARAAGGDGQRLQLGGHGGVVAEREARDRPVLQRHQRAAPRAGPARPRPRRRRRARRTASPATAPAPRRAATSARSSARRRAGPAPRRAGCSRRCRHRARSARSARRRAVVGRPAARSPGATVTSTVAGARRSRSGSSTRRRLET